MSKKLVVYFSATGTTEDVAKALAEQIDADLFEIEPEIRYAAADLDWTNEESRSSIHMANPPFRPPIVDTDAHAEDYDIIYLGFPIWWHRSPTIVHTFLEEYDLSGKTLILFATSGKDDFGETVTHIEESVDDSVDIREGMVFKKGFTQDDVDEWIKTL